MHMILAAIFMALTVPAIYVGLKLVLAFSLPFHMFCIPMLVCLAISMFFVAKADAAA